MKNGVQEPPDDPRIYNRRQPDGSFRPLSGFFEPVDRVTTGETECVECGHERRFSDNEGGICEVVVGQMEASDFFADPLRQPVRCGCCCKFSSSISREGWVDDYRRSRAAPVPTVEPSDGSLTPEQVNRAALIAESRGIDLETAQELVYLRDRVAHYGEGEQPEAGMNTETTYSIALEIASRILSDEQLANRQGLIEYIDGVLQRRLSQESGNESAESVNAEQNIGLPGSELRPTPASNGAEVVVSGSLLVIRSPHFQQDAKVAVLTHPQAHAVIRDLIAVHGVPDHREGGSVSTTEGATVPSQPSPESAVQAMKSACIAKVREIGEGYRNRENHPHSGAVIAAQTADYIARQLESLTPVSESLTPDVQGKLVAEKSPCCGWDVRGEYIVRDKDTLECSRCGQRYVREALALLDGK